jgi:hypothetical protein
MWSELYEEDVGGLSGAAYWSSSEVSAQNAYYADFGFTDAEGTVQTGSTTKTDLLRVRAVRRF